MRLSAILLLVAVAAGCASAGRSSDEERVPETVQLTVINEYVGTVTAYAVWGRNRMLLGDVGPNRTRVFVAQLRNTQVAIGLEGVGAPPGGTGTGPSRLHPYGESAPMDVVGGDALEFRLSAGGFLTVRRLEAGL